MEKNNLEITQELEQMREQFRILSEKVEKQNIISEKQIRMFVKNKMKAYEWWETWVQIFGLIAGCPALLMVARHVGMAPWVNVMTIAYCILGLCLILFRKYKTARLADYGWDMKRFASGVQSVKKLHTCSIAVNLPLALLYISLFSMEFFCATRNSIDNISTGQLATFISLAIATVALALIVDNKKRALLDDIINEIEE